jgi:hypothetical protein
MGMFCLLAVAVYLLIPPDVTGGLFPSNVADGFFASQPYRITAAD